MRHLEGITEILASELSGEEVTACTQVLLEGSVGQLGGAVAIGAAVASSDSLTAAFSPGGYLAVTPTRVFALGQTAMKARPKDLVFALSRADLKTERGRKRLMGLVKLDTITLTQADFSITFHIPKNAKADGLALLSELGA